MLTGISELTDNRAYHVRMSSNTDSAASVDRAVRRLYERYRSAETDDERTEIALEMGALDGRRHAAIYEQLETE